MPVLLGEDKVGDSAFGVANDACGVRSPVALAPATRLGGGCISGSGVGGTDAKIAMLALKVGGSVPSSASSASYTSCSANVKPRPRAECETSGDGDGLDRYCVDRSVPWSGVSSSPLFDRDSSDKGVAAKFGVTSPVPGGG